MAPRPSERGFTLLEMLVAAALWFALGGGLLFVTQATLSQTQITADRRTAYMQLSHLTEIWDAEATSALAIFVPPQDVLGRDNTDGHELDFYSRDASRVGHFWAYRWDAGANTLTRYAYARPGEVPTSDPPLSGITAFRAARKPASSLAPPFLGGYAARDVMVNFGYPGVDGGNAIVAVTVANARTQFESELLPGTMTSGFQVIVGTFTPSPAATPVSPTATPTPALSPTPARTATPSAPPATSTPTPAPPTPSPTPTPCVAEFPMTLTFFGLTWWEGQQSGSPCGGYISSVAFVFATFPAVDMVPLNTAFTAIPPYGGARFGYFVTLQDLTRGIQIAPGYFVNTGDTLAASAALPCKYIFMSNPATITVIVGFGGIALPTNDSAIPSIVTNLQQAIPGCVPVE